MHADNKFGRLRTDDCELRTKLHKVNEGLEDTVVYAIGRVFKRFSLRVRRRNGKEWAWHLGILIQQFFFGGMRSLLGLHRSNTRFQFLDSWKYNFGLIGKGFGAER
jgi:hypothetical protein